MRKDKLHTDRLVTAGIIIFGLIWLVDAGFGLMSGGSHSGQAGVLWPCSPPCRYLLLSARIAFVALCFIGLRRQMRLAREVDALCGELERKTEEFDTFSYTVSHDLRAPLTRINGFAELLRDDCRDRLDPQSIGYLDRIVSAGEQLDREIEVLLIFSRAGRKELEMAECDLGEMATAIMAGLRIGAPDRPVELAIAPHLPARGDERLLRIVLENLFSNAWKFTRDAAPARIEFAATERKGERVFYLGDNGVGFAPEVAGRLFLPFQLGHDVREFPGAGLGLATVKRIVERHGGRIWAEGAVGGGATFFFTLG